MMLMSVHVDQDQQLHREFEITSRRRKDRTTPRVPQESVQMSLDITGGFANIRPQVPNAFERATTRLGRQGAATFHIAVQPAAGVLAVSTARQCGSSTRT